MSAPRCPFCGRVMSNREAIEQDSCNDCFGGAYDPNPSEEREAVDYDYKQTVIAHMLGEGETNHGR